MERENRELYSDKFVLSVVNLNQIDKATEEDRKYGIDRWAQLFKATTWEAIKTMAKEELQAKDDALQAKEDELKSLTEEIARLKALLAEK